MTIDSLKSLLAQKLISAPEGSFEIQRHENNVRIGALTLIGEARGESYDSRIAIAHTFDNRAIEKTRQITDICLQHAQYSCWWGDDDNAVYVRGLAEAIFFTKAILSPSDSRLFAACKYLVGGVLTHTLPDNTHGATHYYSPRSMIPTGRVPDWAKGRMPTASIGHSLFYAGVPWN